MDCVAASVRDGIQFSKDFFRQVLDAEWLSGVSFHSLCDAQEGNCGSFQTRALQVGVVVAVVFLVKSVYTKAAEQNRLTIQTLSPELFLEAQKGAKMASEYVTHTFLHGREKKAALILAGSVAILRDKVTTLLTTGEKAADVLSAIQKAKQAAEAARQVALQAILAIGGGRGTKELIYVQQATCKTAWKLNSIKYLLRKIWPRTLAQDVDQKFAAEHP